MRQKPTKICLDPLNNVLFDILPEEIATEDVASQYAKHQRAANPDIVPEKAAFRNGFFAHHSNRYLPGFDYEAPKYKDGLLETETTFLDISGTPITFAADAADGVFLASSPELDGQIAFAGNKFCNWGWIQLTDSSKNGCYRALYDPNVNTLYTLPEGLEMSRLDHNAEALLYRIGPDGQPESAQKTVLKMYPSIMMYASNVLYPWEDDKIYSDVCPMKLDGTILIPFQAVFEHLFADVTWDPAAQIGTAAKVDASISVTAGSSVAVLNGKEYLMQAPACVVHDRLMVPVEIATAFFDVTVQWNEEKNLIRFVKQRPYWDKWEKIENSYTTIPLSSSETYPAYLQKEAEQTVSDIRSIEGEEQASIAFMTDIHYKPCENDHIRLERTLNTYRDIAGKIKLDGLALGGDRIFEASKEIRTQAMQSYRSHLEGIQYFPVCGNHDAGGQWDNYVIHAVDSSNNFTKNDWFNGFYNHLGAENAVFNSDDTDNQLYYYLDNPERKVRYIFLDSSDAPQKLDENGKLVYNPIGYLAFSQKQIDWVSKQALNMPEDGWTALVFVHHIIDPEQAADYEMTIQKNRHTQAMVKLLDAYRAGEDLNTTLYEEHPDFMLHLAYNFSEYHRAEIAGVIMGHTHRDHAQYSQTGIPYIHTACAYADNVYCNPGAPERNDGTKAEILFDIVTISKTNKVLYLTRVGAGSDRVFPYG